MKDGKWITFVELESSGVTRKFNVHNKENGGNIGQIKWYGAFRKYSFFPNDNIVFESQCLRDIASSLDELMQERKLQKQIQQ